MDKRKPTYDLATIKAALGSIDTLSITTSALRDATSIGFDRASIVETITTMNRAMFYKSMNAFTDHRLWQDVYHVPSRGMVLYIKLQASIVTAFTIVSFKENEHGS